MKKIGLLLLALLISVTAFAACSGDDGSGDSKALKIGVSGEYYPFCFSENDELQGFEIDMWNEIAKRLGYTVEYSTSDFAGLLGMLDSGKIDSVGYGVAVNAERQEKYLFSDPYLYSDFCVVTQKDSELDSLEDFIGKKIGVVMGGEGERKLKEVCEAEGLDINITGYEGTAAMDEDVQLGRIEARLGPKIQTLANIKKNDLNMEVTDIVIFTETEAYPFPKSEKYEELLPQVNEILAAMREDGTLAGFSEKWFGIDATNQG